MNPPGEWVFKNMEWQFLNHAIMAIYGKVFPVRTGFGTRWKWVVNVGLDSRIDLNEPIQGYTQTEEESKIIVECILKNTRTCEFKLCEEK